MPVDQLELSGVSIRIGQVMVANALCIIVGTFILLNKKREPIRPVHIGILLFFITFGWLSAVLSAYFSDLYSWLYGFMIFWLIVPRLYQLVENKMRRQATKKEAE
jgi:hypothetical protein